MDACLFMSQNFGFISLPDELTTGSSIMPHKRIPTFFEIMRGRCNRLQSVPNEIALLTTNLPVGYHRDLQLMKDILFPATTEIKRTLRMCDFMLAHLRVNEHILDDRKYDYLFTVEDVNRLVLQGTPFREAYKEVGMACKGRIHPHPRGAPHPRRQHRQPLHRRNPAEDGTRAGRIRLKPIQTDHVMTRLNCIAWLLPCICAAAVAPASGQTKVKTSVEKVTLFIDGAQVTRTKQIDLPAGNSTLVFTGLSPYLDDKSMQVAAKGRFTVTAVNRLFNHTDSLRTLGPAKGVGAGTRPNPSRTAAAESRTRGDRRGNRSAEGQLFGGQPQCGDAAGGHQGAQRILRLPGCRSSNAGRSNWTGGRKRWANANGRCSPT